MNQQSIHKSKSPLKRQFIKDIGKNEKCKSFKEGNKQINK